MEDEEGMEVETSSALVIHAPLRGEEEHAEELMRDGIPMFRTWYRSDDLVRQDVKQMHRNCEEVENMERDNASDDAIMEMFRQQEFKEPLLHCRSGKIVPVERFIRHVMSNWSIRLITLLSMCGVSQIAPLFEDMKRYAKSILEPPVVSGRPRGADTPDWDPAERFEDLRKLLCLVPGLREYRHIRDMFPGVMTHCDFRGNSHRYYETPKNCSCHPFFERTDGSSIEGVIGDDSKVREWQERKQKWLCEDMMGGPMLPQMESMILSQDFLLYPKFMFDVLRVDMNKPVSYNDDIRLKKGHEIPLWLYMWYPIRASRARCFPYTVSCYDLQTILQWTFSERFDWSYRTSCGETFFSRRALLLFEICDLESILLDHPTAYRILTYVNPVSHTTAIQRVTEYYNSGYVKMMISEGDPVRQPLTSSFLPSWMSVAHKRSSLTRVKLVHVHNQDINDEGVYRQYPEIVEMMREDGYGDRVCTVTLARHLRPYTPADHHFVHWNVQMAMETMMMLVHVGNAQWFRLPPELLWHIATYLHTWSYLDHLKRFMPKNTTVRRFNVHRAAVPALVNPAAVSHTADSYSDELVKYYKRTREAKKNHPSALWMRNHHRRSETRRYHHTKPLKHMREKSGGDGGGGGGGGKRQKTSD